jgi:hypothetical protein
MVESFFDENQSMCHRPLYKESKKNCRISKGKLLRNGVSQVVFISTLI